MPSFPPVRPIVEIIPDCIVSFIRSSPGKEKTPPLDNCPAGEGVLSLEGDFAADHGGQYADVPDGFSGDSKDIVAQNGQVRIVTGFQAAFDAFFEAGVGAQHRKRQSSQQDRSRPRGNLSNPDG